MGEASLWGVILGGGHDNCPTDSESVWGWIVHPFLMLYAFYILARICDGHLTTALEFIVDRIQMSEDVAGATFLAMASSAPELFTSIIATCVLESSSGVGNILGSAVFNLLVIIGVVPVFAKGTLHIWWYPTARDACFYSMAIIEVFFVMRDGLVYWWEGLIMVVSYLSYVLYFTQNEKIIKHWNLRRDDEESCPDGDVKANPSAASSIPSASPEVVPVVRNVTGDAGGESEVSTEEIPEVGHQERRSVSKNSQGSYDKEHSAQHERSGPRVDRANSKNNFSLKGIPKSSRPSACKVFPEPSGSEGNPTPPEEDHPANLTAVVPIPSVPEDSAACPDEGDSQEESGFCRYEPIMLVVDMVMPTSPERLYTLFGLCCAWIGLFTYVAVDSSTRLGCLLDLDDEVMGLVILAAGTSVPDAMGSIAVARDGMGDMAVANAVGSNTFDILLGLGFPWFIWGIVKGEPIDFRTAEHTDFAIAVLCCCLIGYLILIIGNGWILTKKLGGLLLISYVLVVVLILLRYYGHF